MAAGSSFCRDGRRPCERSEQRSSKYHTQGHESIESYLYRYPGLDVCMHSTNAEIPLFPDMDGARYSRYARSHSPTIDCPYDMHASPTCYNYDDASYFIKD